MSVLFLSKEWLEEITEAFNEEFSIKGNVTTAFAQIITETPDGVNKWLVLTLKDSLLVSYEMGTGPVPPTELSATGTYKTLERVITEVIDGADGIATGEFMLGGNVIKAMSLLGTYNRLEEVQRSIKTSF